MQAKNMQMPRRDPFGISLRSRDVSLNNYNVSQNNYNVSRKDRHAPKVQWTPLGDPFGISQKDTSAREKDTHASQKTGMQAKSEKY